MDPNLSNNLIAVINSNQDIIEAIQLTLSEEGFQTVVGHVVDFKEGKDNFIDYLNKHNPSVIIFDIAPPYHENWNYFRVLENLKESEGRHFILTTTNKDELAKYTDIDEVIEIIGKPFDLDAIVHAVRKSLQTAEA